MGVAVGDYNNDGFEDLFVAGVHGNHLYRNSADGTFRDVTEAAGLAKVDKQYGPCGRSEELGWTSITMASSTCLCELPGLGHQQRTGMRAAPGKLDYCHPKFYKATPNQLFLNNGDGTFRDISAESGIRANPGKGMGVGIADFDLDGWMDIFVANDKMYNSRCFTTKGAASLKRLRLTPTSPLRKKANLSRGWEWTRATWTTTGFRTSRWSPSLTRRSRYSAI